GQYITAARTTAAIAEFFANDGYKHAKDLLSGELKKILEALLERVKSAVDPENLVRLLIFGDERLDLLLAYGGGGAEESPGKKSSSTSDMDMSWVQRVIKKIRNLGKALFNALQKLHGLVQVPMQDVREFTSTRPALAFAITFAADHIYQL